MTRAMMALFDVGHRLPLPNGHSLEKQDEDMWQVRGPMGGTPDVYLAMVITGTVRVGDGGSMDSAAKDFADAMNANTPST